MLAPERFLSLAQIAERWGCSTKHVRHLIGRGGLPGSRFGAMWRVTVSDLVAYEAGARTALPLRPPDAEPKTHGDATADIEREARVRTILEKLRAPERPTPQTNGERRRNGIARQPVVPPGRRIPSQDELDALKGIALLRRRRDIAAAKVQLPVIYPRNVTAEQKWQIGWACWHCGIFVRQLAIPRGIGGRSPDDPELVAVLAKLDRMLEEGERKLQRGG